MLSIVHVESDSQRQQVRELWTEYLTWLVAEGEQAFAIRMDLHQLLESTMTMLHEFTPPDGKILLAYDDGAVAGCVALRTIAPRVGEIKRLYVRPQHRGKGVGRALIAGLIAAARDMGCATLRLDSAPFMQDAQALYRAVGFSPREPYPESEVPEAFHAHVAFMELRLEQHGAEREGAE